MTVNLDIRRALALMLLTLVVCGLALARAPEVVLAKRPNIIVIQTDDQGKTMLKGRYRGPNGRSHLIMPNTVRGLLRQGAEFRNYYASSPVCSPSRASLLTGQYPQNTGMLANRPPLGGWSGWQALPTWNENVPVTLQVAGYRTAHFGKFLNAYYDTALGRVDSTVPPGWDRWLTTAFIRATPYYGYEVNDNGQVRGPFGTSMYEAGVRGVDPPSCRVTTVRTRDGRRCIYLTDFMTRGALREIRRNGRRRGRPFYLQLDYQAPHGDSRPPAGPTPASRHLGSASRTPLPRNPAFNEADMSDKPEIIRRLAGSRLKPAAIRKIALLYRREAEALRSVDDGVGAILRALRRTGQLSNTYVFFVTDHGVFTGEHRFNDTKFLGYNPASRVGMAVRGPGVRPGTTVNEVVGNIDLPATVLKLANATPTYQVDGRSMRRFWRRPNQTTRRPYQISLFDRNGDVNLASAGRALGGARISKTGNNSVIARTHYRGFRVGPYRYALYAAGGGELYDLRTDPFELRNQITNPRYFQVRKYLREHLSQIATCKGEGCRAELPPWPEPGS